MQPPARVLRQFRSWLNLHRRFAFLVGVLILGPIVPLVQYARPGPRSDGSTRLVNNWIVTPAGRQTTLGDLPLNSALAPDGQHLLVANGGAGVQSLQVVDTTTTRLVQTIPYTVPDSVFVGVAYSPDGHQAYASGGGHNVVHAYDVLSSGLVTPTGDIVLGRGKENPFPTGLSVSPDGGMLYVANNISNTVALIDTHLRTVSTTVPVGHYPYTTLTSGDGAHVYVSNWGDGTVSVIDTGSKTVSATITVGSHPSAMIFGPDQLLFVADSNSDAVSVIDTTTNQQLRLLSVAPYAHAPLSSSPQGLAVSHDGQRLYVANAGSNEVMVFALHGRNGPEQRLGRIPTAWYPTSVAVSPDNGSLFVTNAKGLGAGPNNAGYFPSPQRANPPFVDVLMGYNDRYCNCTYDQYSGSMIHGTLSTIAVPGKGRLQVYTNQVMRNNHQGDQSLLLRSRGNPVPRPGGTSPIKHVIYIIKENRTYDQVFGDASVGDGDQSLTLFPRANTPNLHALADRFGLLDNFYADAEVSADGHNWANSANASDYNEKMWPQDYSPGDGRNRGYDFEGGSSINLSPGGYLWDAAAEAHISYRDYGEFVQFDANYPASRGKLIPESQADTCVGPVAHAYSGMTIPNGQVLCFLPMNINPSTTPNLIAHYDPKFRTFDMRYREADRLAEWQREFDNFVTTDSLPQLEIVRLPNDHTSGTSPTSLTPQAFVAENDAAVGNLVSIVSKSKYWGSTAIFVTEDDAQNGPDHVDAHRTTSLVISPYTSRGYVYVDHTLYDTAAMVRTMELLVGLRPLSQYDAVATPMWHLFQRTPDLRTYDTLAETTRMVTNAPNAYGAERSAKMDFSQEDRMPMDELNHILWGAVKGADKPYPALPDAVTSRQTPAGDGD
ncbi:MAG: bifunctional YncE family protein/alkaline phosphatase family protein [Herpetosiphonaceae bacterium]|nr:bifunctional YncE family protein/alkaline phosphatase family protein [Herpetosiphonaceae bacterium]